MTEVLNPYTAAADELREYVQRLDEIVDSPGFHEIIDELETATPEERPEVIQEVASVEAFRERGIPTPEGLRVSPRVFEDPDAAWQKEVYQPFKVEDVEAQPTPAATFCVSVGFFLCISYGS